MPSNKYTQRCLTCSHPLDIEALGVKMIRMNNQPRYYHVDPRDCQMSEQHTDLDFIYNEREVMAGVKSRIRMIGERNERVLLLFRLRRGIQMQRRALPVS